MRMKIHKITFFPFHEKYVATSLSILFILWSMVKNHTVLALDEDEDLQAIPESSLNKKPQKSESGTFWMRYNLKHIVLE
jgi:hypothetical protein